MYKKLLSILAFSLLNSSAFSYTIISEEHSQSLGVRSFPPVVMTPGDASTHQVIDTLTAQVGNASAKEGKIVSIPMNQKVCLRNNSGQAMQYGYRFEFVFKGQNVLDAQTFVFQPGEFWCPNRSGFGNFDAGVKGKFTAVATTRGAEGQTTKEAKGQGSITIN